MRYRRWACFVAAWLGIASLAVGAEPKQPAVVVEHLHAVLVSMMKDGAKLGYQGRLKLIRPVLSQTDDWPTVCRSVLGKSWAKLSEDQKTKFEATFEELSSAMYAANFDSYSGEKFKTVEERTLPRGSVLVRAQLLVPGEEAVHFDYVLREYGGKWKIVNIIVDGVSDVALKRAEYGQVMEQDGLDGLLKKMREKIAAQEHEKYQAPQR